MADSKNANPMLQLKIPRKFEIRIEEADWTDVPDNGQPRWKPVPSSEPIIIKVSSPKELQEMQSRYQMCDQRMRIVREIDPPTKEDIERLAKEQGVELEKKDEVKAEQVPEAQTKAVNKPIEQVVEASQPIAQPKAKPKIVTIGDIQLKYDGDKVYQKQWIKLNAVEAKNFRVVNDSNNKLTPMIGKHIEALKWVLVEESTETEDNSVEGLLNE